MFFFLRNLTTFSFFLFYSIFSLGLSVLLMVISYLIVQQNPYREKISTYECGFEPFEDARNKFEVHFYIVAILFLIFDIEVIYLMPWIFSFSSVGFLGFWAMILFLIILILGFIYEIYMGALEWQ